ncbi:CRE-TAG-164 protein [Caenorhabditis remanei]|uniref:CRE-TAG-164 protein n=1 Tax=Caenorhabditis remanei TaxID=31234 RepID=E3NAD5_CAERE|nr:CRE-TAG-164 protein [Caenorhabditis remanei]
MLKINVLNYSEFLFFYKENGRNRRYSLNFSFISFSIKKSFLLEIGEMSESKETDNNLNGQSTGPVAVAEPTKKDEAKKEDSKKGEEEQMKTAKSESLSKRKAKRAKQLSGRSNTSSKKTRSRLSIRRTLRDDPEKEMKATLLTFQAVKNKPEQARVQLLLCNISDRDIFVKLRCSAASNVTALPAGSGHISPKSQMRILLSWKMPEGFTQWKDLRMPKLLLTTYFMQSGEKSADEAPTNTRLMARVSTSKQCDPDSPPIEQLLLDAVGKDLGVTP